MASYYGTAYSHAAMKELIRHENRTTSTLSDYRPSIGLDRPMLHFAPERKVVPLRPRAPGYHRRAHSVQENSRLVTEMTQTKYSRLPHMNHHHHFGWDSVKCAHPADFLEKAMSRDCGKSTGEALNYIERIQKIYGNVRQYNKNRSNLTAVSANGFRDSALFFSPTRKGTPGLRRAGKGSGRSSSSSRSSKNSAGYRSGLSR
mmetsp:Transcript_5321/g.5875  ORF Transcript_5321/g.5875 Transcript_5321/m.5875 type:complete len:202 (-) Transcript_5321:27-632(-)